MTFQDLLPLVAESIKNPRLHDIALHHGREDAGHHLWFFQDLTQLDVQPIHDIFTLYNSDSFYGRRITYALMSEIWRLEDDFLRIALLMSLESSGQVFFSKMADYAAAQGLEQKLKYFGAHHIKVEKAHTVFHAKVEAWLLEQELSPACVAEGLNMVDRTHEVFHELFDLMVQDLSN